MGDLADVAFTQRHVLWLDDAGPLEWAGRGDDLAVQAHLGWHEHRPRRGAVATNLYRDPPQGPGRALQRGSQFLVAHWHAQAGIELVDFDFITTFGLTGGQVVFYGEFKKALSDADKEIRQGNRSIGEGTAARGEQADSQQRT